LDIVSWIFIKFLEVKIEINQDNLTPCEAHRVLKNLLLGCPKYKHFSYFHSSCQLGLNIRQRGIKSPLSNIGAKLCEEAI
jgi:hypothetical protein